MLDLDSNLNFAATLLTQYSFDLGNRTASELVATWREKYPAIWVCQAVIEALYQGRYKAVSVEQILSFWQRRGHVLHRYNYEFERLICHDDRILNGQQVAGDEDIISTNEPSPVPLPETVAERSEESVAKKSDRLVQQKSDPRRQIKQFTPAVNASEFYTKLKAISQYERHEFEQNTRQ